MIKYNFIFQESDQNIIVVKWKKFSFNDYFATAKKAKFVGKSMAALFTAMKVRNFSKYLL